MRVYLAAPYRRRDELRGYRDELETACEHPDEVHHDPLKGIHVTVTSRWLDGDRLLPEERAASNPEAGRPFAEKDVRDVSSADLLVLFTEEVRNNHRGGYHVEFGLAIALGKMLAIVGPRMNVFHTLEGVRHFHRLPAVGRSRIAQGWLDCRDWLLGGCK